MHLDQLLEKINLHAEEAQEHPSKVDPLGDGISAIELIRISGSDLDIVNAARVSYGKISTEVTERDEKLINFLMEYKHTSPFEHNQLSFRVKCPMYVARQWMRHRMNSYNEISYRYAKAKLEFYIPSKWRTQDKINKQASGVSYEDEHLKAQYINSLKVATEAYLNMLEQGVCRELARGVLPVCVYTEFIFTCNLHSLMHFLTLRLDPGAQHEIRAYAEAMYQLAQPHFPMALKAWAQHLKPREEG